MSKPNKPRNNSKRILKKRIAIAAVVVALLGLLATVGWWQYRRIQHRRVVALGRTLLEKKDYQQAGISILRAIQLNPRDLEAYRMMVEVTKATQSRQELRYRHIVAQLEPGVLQNHLDLAECALRHQLPEAAEQALANVNAEGQKTAAFHEVAGHVALARKDLAEAESHFTQAVALDSKSEQSQLNLAFIRLHSKDEETHKQARATIESVGADSKFFRSASRVLLQDAVERKDWDYALVAGRKLQSAPNASFEDQLLYLGILRDVRPKDYQSFLLDLQERSVKDPDQVAELISWMNGRGMNMVALDWGNRLPEDIRNQPPVSPAIAESYTNLHDWAALKGLVSNTDWKDLEFRRLALLSLVLRQEGNLDGSRGEWSSAVQAAGDRPEMLAALADFATGLKWDSEASDLLWSVARGPTRQQWALKALLRKYTAAHDTRALINVTNRILELDSQDTAAKSRMASLLFQTNASLERAGVLAREAYEKDPKDPRFAATYAYALHLQGKTTEGMEIMRSVPAKTLETAPYSTFNAVLLANAGTPDEAYKFIELAEKGSLVPEETEILAKARMALRRRGFSE